MFKYEYTKEFYEKYIRNMMIVFSDNELTKNNIKLVQDKLKEYGAINYEVVEIETLFDKNKEKCLIMLVIICSRLLLKNVSEKQYIDFIKTHRNEFKKFYNNEIIPLIDL